MNYNLYSLFQQRWRACHAKSCFVLPHGRVHTYADVERRSAQYANALRELGLIKGDRVAVQVEKSLEAALLYLGCLRTGLVFLPINPAYQRDETAYLLQDAEPELFVCQLQRRSELEPLAVHANVHHIFELDDAGNGDLATLADHYDDAAPVEHCKSDDLAALLYTSGTTGRSKGAMLSHQNLSANTAVLHDYWRWQQDDVLLHMLPIFHVHGLFVALNGALYAGATMLFEPKFDVSRALELLPHSTIFMGVPTYYTRLLGSQDFGAQHCTGMRLFVSGSAPLGPEIFDRFKERTGHTILERYGMTETNMLASNPYEGERRRGTVGPPLPGVSIRVVDDAGREVPKDTVGHIQVRGDNVFRGYWQLPERTKEEFTADGFFKTGDMGCFDERGYLSIVGRHKDLIITGGLNVYPKEIEEQIDAIDGVFESAVIGVPHADFGEAVTAVVVRGPSSSITQEQIIANLKKKLAAFKVPKMIHFVEHLPRNTMGKVQKNVLRKILG